MLIRIFDVLTALFRVDDLAALDANREGIAAIINILMGPIANVLRAVGRRPLGISACRRAEKQASQCADQQQCFAKTK